MKLLHKIKIDFLDFLRSGKFDYIKIGQTKEWILNNFPDPDNFEKGNTYKDPIWWYGNLEFHFNGEELSLIYSDYIENLHGGKSLEFSKWIFEDPAELTLAYVVNNLNQQRIGFKIEHVSINPGFSCVRVEILNSKVTLGFAPENGNEEGLEEFLHRNKTQDSNLFPLQSISLK